MSGFASDGAGKLIGPDGQPMDNEAFLSDLTIYGAAGNAFTSGNTTNPYCMYPAASNIEKNTWTLWTYFFLPHWFTDQQGTDFYNDHWCRWAGNYENASADNLSKTAGSRGSNGGNIRVSRFKESDAQIHLRWLDYYNTNANHKTWWALPMIVEIDPMDLGANGTINAFNFTETDEHLKY